MTTSQAGGATTGLSAFFQGIETDIENVFKEVENAAETFVQDLVAGIEAVGPGVLASAATAAVAAATDATTGKLDLGAAITAAKTSLEGQGIQAAESVVTGAVSAAAASLTAAQTVNPTATATTVATITASAS